MPPSASVLDVAPGRVGRAGLGVGAVHALLLLSGAAGLGYQVVWTRMLSVGLGHEVLAVLAVVAAFFAGLALGAVLLDRRVAASARPGRWYAGLEIAVGLWSLALVWLIPLAGGWMAEATGPEPGALRRWAVAFLGPALLLLPATLAMGATLPAAERLHARRSGDARAVGGLYAANAAGGALGAIAAVGLIAPLLGFTATLIAFAAINLACAALTLAGPARDETGHAGRHDEPGPVETAPAAAGPSAGRLALLGLTGLLGIGVEVAVVRALSQLSEDTVYTFAAVLAVYLVATTAGAGAWQRRVARAEGGRHEVGALLGLTALATAWALAALVGLSRAYPSLAGATPALPGGGFLAEALAAVVVLGPAAAAMGALFACLAQGARGPGGGLGLALAANTAGAALAPLAAGVLAVPALGVAGTLCLIVGGYGALWLRAALGGAERRGATLAGAAAVLSLAALLAGFAPPVTPEGGRAVERVEGVAGTATVVATADGERWLTVDATHVMGGSATYRLDRTQGHAALLRHPAPRRALFLGLGTGATLAAAAAYPDLDATGVELMDEVLALGRHFPAVARDLDDPAIDLVVADARRYAAATDERFDVILADTYHPARDGAGLLYTVEHYRAIRERLAEGGLAVQWLPLHQLDLATLRLIVRGFLAVFPDARLAMGNANVGTPLLMLSAYRDGGAPNMAALIERRAPARLRRELAAIGLDGPFALFGGFLAGPEALAAFAGDGPLNTDDHPRVVFEAPTSVYRPLGPAVDRLLTLVGTLARTPEEAVDLSGVPHRDAFARRLARYWRARDAFLRLGAERAADLRAGGITAAEAKALVPRLIDILKTSPDFAPAYEPLVGIARALALSEPPIAVGILEALIVLVPRRPEARELREAILRGGRTRDERLRR